MKLKKGITGFWNLIHDKPAPSINQSTFLSSVNEINKSSDYHITAVLDVQVSNNFFTLKIVNKIKNLKFSILINAQYPYYCGVTAESSWMNLNFIDLESKIRVYFDKKFDYLSPNQLNKNVVLTDLKDLSPTEIDQINYWNSESFGQIIFNGYD